jgi:hypothetical protein
MNFDPGDVLRRAGQIAWKHRVLWVFGFLQTMAGFLFVPLALAPALAPLISDRSGGSINEPRYLFLFMASVLVLILLLSPLSILMNGALSVGVLQAEQREEKLLVMEAIRSSFSFFWRLAGLTILFGAGMVLSMLVFSMLSTILTVLTLGVGAIPLSILTYPLMLVWYIWMEQSTAAIVVDRMDVLSATKQGWQVFKENPGVVGVIGLVLYMGISLIGGLAVLPLLAPFFVIPFVIALEEFNRNILLTAGVCAAIYLPLFAIFQGALMAFMKSGWILTYLRLRRSPIMQPLVQEPAL